MTEVEMHFNTKVRFEIEHYFFEIQNHNPLNGDLFQRLCDNMSQNLVEQLAARRRARGAALNSTLLAVVTKDETDEQKVVPKNSPPPSKKVFKAVASLERL